MRHFPISIELDGQSVVVSGAGETAVAKLRLLLKTTARIAVYGAAPDGQVRAWAAAGKLTLHERAVAAGDGVGARLFYAANDDPDEDARAAAIARRAGALVNVVDDLEQSAFITPAVVDRDPITVAIGTEGTAPVIARDIKAKVEAWLPARLGEVARQSAALREPVARAVPDKSLRRRVWERLLGGRWREAVLAGRSGDATDAFETAVGSASDVGREPGRVSLVGTGPGDPELLTLKAQRRMQEADVLVVDGLVTPEILEFARREARQIHVGKKGYGNATDQDEINRILVREALKGHHVVRLKGGDPFIFARALEELTALNAAGIAVDVVPGVTAAHACAAQIGLPVTQRDRVRQFSIVTATTKAGLAALDWHHLARPGHATAIYMGIRNAAAVRERLLGAGARGDLAVVVVENGTRADERVIATTLDDLADAVAESDISGPALIFLGLSWEEAHLSAPRHVEHFRARTKTAPVAAAQSEAKPEPEVASVEDITLRTFWVAG